MGEKSIRISVRAHGEGPKPYERPTLRKGPALSRVTAFIGSNITPSDTRLKRDIHMIGRLANGLTLYRFRYLWSDVEMVGVMAQEVLEVVPQAVTEGADGYYRVDYGLLGLRCVTYAEWLAERALAEAA